MTASSDMDTPARGENRKDLEELGRLRLAFLLSALFALATLPRLLTHELWRDEAWLWLVVTESASLRELAASLERSGQGYLFPLLCYFAKAVSTSPWVMQGIHLVLAVAGTFAFVYRAPLSRTARTLFVFGYLPFYEYAVLSRHYAAGALLLWLACAAAQSRRPALPLGLALGLLCQTTVYGYILAVAVGGGFLVDRWLRRHPDSGSATIPGEGPLRPAASPGSPAPISHREAAAGLVLALAGGLAGLLQLMPAAGTSFAPGWRFGWQPEILERALQMPWRAFVPIPQPGLHFWNSNLLDPWPTLQATAGLLLFIGANVLVWPRKAALTTLLLGSAGLFAFGYIKFIGAMRHDGHWWLLFVAALWLGGGGAICEGSRLDRRGAPLAWRSAVLLGFLLVHVGAGAYASWMDLRHPFSNAAAAARLVRDLGLEKLPLLAYREPPAAPVALALGRPLFSPSRGRFATHPDWGPEQRELTLEELRCAARGLSARSGSDVGLILNRTLPPWDEITPAGTAVGAIQSSEDYFLYRLLHARLPASAPAARCPP